MQLKQKHIVINNEKGIVLVVVIMLMAVLVLLGTTAIMVTTTDMKISSNYRSGSQAFYIAEAGIEQARAKLRTDTGTDSLTTLLEARVVGGDGALSDSSIIANFYSNGGFVTDDVAYIANTAFGAGSYCVYLTNDVPDTVTSTTDTNKRVTLTSFGQGPNNSFAIIQSVVQKLTLPPLPGAIVLPGPTVVYKGANSNASSVAGGSGSESAISLTSLEAESSVEKYLTDINRIDKYTCNGGSGSGVDCIKKEPAELFDPAYSTLSGINNLYNTIKSVADTVLTGPRNLTAAEIGTTEARKIVVVDGAAEVQGITGAGILVVTGTLTLSGSFNYNGFIMCIGQGHLVRNGGGSGEIKGGIFVANTNDATSDTVLGIPTFDTSGGGNSNIIYDGSQINPPGGGPFIKLSWKQI